MLEKQQQGDTFDWRLVTSKKVEDAEKDAGTRLYSSSRIYSKGCGSHWRVLSMGLS